MKIAFSARSDLLASLDEQSCMAALARGFAAKTGHGVPRRLLFDNGPELRAERVTLISDRPRARLSSAGGRGRLPPFGADLADRGDRRGDRGREVLTVADNQDAVPDGVDASDGDARHAHVGDRRG